MLNPSEVILFGLQVMRGQAGSVQPHVAAELVRVWANSQTPAEKEVTLNMLRAWQNNHPEDSVVDEKAIGVVGEMLKQECF